MGKVSTGKKGTGAVVAAANGIAQGTGSGTPRQRRPSYDEIAMRAYAIYEREGRPEGRDVEHWLQAETELSDPKN